MREELDHCVEHMEKGEFASIMLHCLNFKEAGQAVFLNAQEIADPEQALEVHRLMHERVTGQPHVVVELPNGVYAIVAEEVEVPKDISGINGEG